VRVVFHLHAEYCLEDGRFLRGCDWNRVGRNRTSTHALRSGFDPIALRPA